MHRIGPRPASLFGPGVFFLALIALCLAAARPLPAPAREPYNPSQIRMNKFDAQEKVRAYLKERLYYPDTYVESDWSELTKFPGDGPFVYAIRHLYWTKPEYGPMGWADNIFYFGPQGEIVSIENIAPGKEKPMKHPMRPDYQIR